MMNLMFNHKIFRYATILFLICGGMNTKATQTDVASVIEKTSTVSKGKRKRELWMWPIGIASGMIIFTVMDLLLASVSIKICKLLLPQLRCGVWIAGNIVILFDKLVTRWTNSYSGLGVLMNNTTALRAICSTEFAIGAALGCYYVSRWTEPEKTDNTAAEQDITNTMATCH
jgi:hypothetical protein